MLSLMITGFSGEPERISEILGITPTEVHKAGEIGRSGRPYESSGWLVSVEASKGNPGAEHHRLLEELLGLLAGKEDRFSDLRNEARPQEVTIYGGFYVHPAYHEGVWLEPAQMRLLADCGIGWGLDVFVTTEEPENSATAAT